MLPPTLSFSHATGPTVWKPPSSQTQSRARGALAAPLEPFPWGRERWQHPSGAGNKGGDEAARWASLFGHSHGGRGEDGEMYQRVGKGKPRHGDWRMLGLHPPQCRVPGAGEPRAIPRRSPGPGIRRTAPLRSPREKRSGSLRRLRRKPRRSRTRTRALAPSPLRPPPAPLRPGSGPPRPCPSASARTNRVAWTAQRWSRGLTNQSPNCLRLAPGSDVPGGSVAT